MTPEEARKKYGMEKATTTTKRGYVNCIRCPVRDDVCDGNKTGYQDCWETIAKSTGWKPEEENKSDAVNHPQHYQGKYECIEELIALFGVQAVKDFCRCNVYKYRFRADRKNGEEDIKKAEWYMEKLMELEK